MYNLTKTEERNGKEFRTYTNSKTGTETQTTHIYTDREGARWFGFVDLFKIPYMRVAYSKHIADLFTMGLGLKDILQWTDEMKTLLKSDDPEKYEKLYALTLEKERIAKNTADPIKQHLNLATVYVLAEEERVDHFDDKIAADKLKLWLADTDALSFFLTWHNEHIQSFTSNLNTILGTVSANNRGKL